MVWGRNFYFYFIFIPFVQLDVEGRMCMGTEHGYICLVNTNNNQGGQLNGRLKEWAAHKNAIYDLKWIDGSKKNCQRRWRQQLVRLGCGPGLASNSYFLVCFLL